MADTTSNKPASTSTAAPAMTIMFRPPYESKTASTRKMLANADIVGCFGTLPIAVKDFALELKADSTIAVYMPSGMYGSKRVGPIGGDMSDADVAAFATRLDAKTAGDFIAEHKAGRAAVETLAQAVRNAWAELPGDGKFGKAVPLTLVPAARK